MSSRRLILSYPPDVVQEPVIYRLVRDYDLLVNILKARIRPQEGGRLVLDLSGEKDKLDSALNYLTSLGIQAKTLVREIAVNEEKCLHCTACVPICPTGAMELDRETWTVSLNHDTCVICESCVNVCVYRAIELHF